jgi:hypothetical protein
MKIQSLDKQCYVEINPAPEGEGHPVFDVEARIDLGHGVFTADVKILAMPKLPEFIIHLESFVLNREMQPKLEGVYESYFSFVSDADNVFLEFSVGDASYYKCNLIGRFEINTDHLKTIVSEFKALASMT